MQIFEEKKVVRHRRLTTTHAGMRRQILLKNKAYQISSRSTLDFVYAANRRIYEEQGFCSVNGEQNRTMPCRVN
jgi:hypothetical protein